MTVASAAVTGPHTITVTYSGAVGSDANNIPDSGSTHDPNYSAMLGKFRSCEGGNNAECDYLVRNYNHSYYTNLVFSPGGAKKIIFVQDGGATRDLLHTDPRHPIDSRATATFHIGSGTWTGKDKWLVDLLTDSRVSYVSSSQTQRGSHTHTVSAATIRASDGQPPVLSGSPSLNLNTGLFFFHFNEGVRGTLTDTSKIMVENVRLTGAQHTTTTGAAAVTLTEQQRQSLAAIQNIVFDRPVSFYEEAILGISPFRGMQVTLEPGAFADAAGNRTARAGNVDLTLTKDTTPPQLLQILTAVDLGAGTVTLSFGEGVSTSRADPSGVTLHGTGSRHVTLSGAAVQETSAYSDEITIRMTPTQKAAVIDPVAFPPGITYGFRDQASFPATSGIGSNSLSQIRIQGTAFRDAAGIAASFALGNSFRIPGGLSDGTAPGITGTPTLFLADGTMRIELDEYVRARSADMSQFKLVAPGKADISLEGSSMRSDGDTLLVTLTEQQRLGAVGMGTAATLKVDAGAVRDLAGNQIAAVSSQALSVEVDRQSPGVSSSTLDEQTGVMTITFSEHVDVTPASRVVLSSIGVRAAGEQPGQAVRLEGSLGTASLDTESDASTLTFTLTEAQRSAVAAHGADELLLDMDAGAVRDLSANPSPQIRGEHVNASADTTAPSILSASLDEGAGALTITFDETIDATPASTRIDLSKIRLSESGASSLAPASKSAPGPGAFSLASASASDGDATKAVITMTEAQRQAAIAFTGAPLLEVQKGAFRDTAGNQVAARSAVPVTVSGTDDVAPKPRLAALNHGTGVLSISFDETIDVTPPSAVSISRLVIYSEEKCDASEPCEVIRHEVHLSSSTAVTDAIPVTAAGSFDPHAAPSPGGPAKLLGTADSDTVKILLTETQRQAALALSGQVSLSIGSGAFSDTAGNAVAEYLGMPLPDGADLVAPTLASASVSGPSEIRAHFSEDLLDSSVQADDFTVTDHPVASVSEDSGTVTIILADQIPATSGQTLRVTLAGPVSDVAGNVLEAGAYTDALNDLVFAAVSEFTVTSDNAVSADHAKNGDTVTIAFTADVAVEGASSTYVTVNSRPATVASTSPDGFTATYAITDADADGPLDIAVKVRTSGGDMTVSSFGAGDLEKDGEQQPNVRVDNRAPTYVDGSLAGFASIYVHYSEQVVSSVSDYHSITIQGGAAHEPTGAEGSRTSHHILVKWDADWHERPIGSDIRFVIGEEVTDLAGNALSNPGPKEIAAVRDADALSNLHLHGLPGNEEELVMSHDTLVRNIHANGGTVPVINIGNFLEPGERHPELAEVDGTHLVFPPGDRITVRTDSSSVTFPPDVHVAGFDEDIGHTITVAVSEREPDAAFEAAHPHIDTDSAHILEFGHPDVDLHFSHPVRVDFYTNMEPDEAVFAIDSQGNTLRVLECGRDVTDSATAEKYIDEEMQPKVTKGSDDDAACVVYSENVIWTEHFSAFGTASPAVTTSKCDDCTAPTLGLDEDGQRVVTGGFSYNGNAADVAGFFTDYPQITAQIGDENTVVLKIYDEDGPGQVRHASVAFGLRAGQSISESLAAISWDRDHAGTETVTVTDPHGAIQDDASVSATEVRCAEGSPRQCLEVTISHTFMAPLGFDMVGTNVWDADRNGRQNYFNHGVRLVGESLVPEPGMLIDGVRFYPVSAGSDLSVVSDGDGNLYRLSPDGQYRPLTNASALYRVPDQFGWAHASDREPMGGYDRQDPRFAGSLAAQEAAALEVLSAMLRGEPLENPGFGAPAALVYHEQGRDGRASDAALHAAILAERERAALRYAQLFED